MEMTNEIIIGFIVIQGAIILAAIGFICKGTNSRLDKIDNKLEKIEAQVNSIDKRLYAVECMIHMQDGCIMKQDHQMRKAE